jgi:hypothetical protein
VDVEALMAARSATARWRSLVDRLPPAELLDLILNESAYHVEMHGGRFAQARENLKKLRSLIRRIQNRGYATLAGLPHTSIASPSAMRPTPWWMPPTPST